MSYRLCWLLASRIRMELEKLVHLVSFIIRILLSLFVCLCSWNVQFKWQFKWREFNRWGRLQNGRTGAEAVASISPASRNVVQWLRGGMVNAGKSMNWYWTQLQWWLMWGLEMGQALLLLNPNMNETGWRMKDQLDVTCYFISLIMCSTCFGH